MGKIKLTINGTAVTAEEGTTILAAALAKGIYIPHLCHQKDLEPVGVCRLCMVEVKGWRKPVISCKTPVEEGLEVITESEEINKIRKVGVELLIASHDSDCLACGKSTNCTLQRVAQHVGVDIRNLGRIRGRQEKLPIDSSNPFFNFDPNRCVLCGICVRTCDELQGLNAIDYVYRGVGTKIAGFYDRSRLESNCESCGECVVRCPVGALIPKDTQPPTHKVKTVCTYCGCGCGIIFGIRDNKLVQANGGINNPASRGRLCVKGRYGYRFVNSPERLTKPLIKKNGEFVESEWDEALDLVAEKFANSKGDQFATIASAKCTNEENYLIQKFTRAVMGTNNIDHCARL